VEGVVPVLEIDGLVSLAVLGFWIFCIIDVVTTDASLMRNLDKPFWVVIVLLFNALGGIIWLVAGRPQRTSTAHLPYKGNAGFISPGPSSRRSSPAPDDDPAFLAGAARRNAEDAAIRAGWDDDLRRREEDLRRREEELRQRREPPEP
jgi:hypothetical protein